jgi:formylglycine-generating enzyme required for sulfatase activity
MSGNVDEWCLNEYDHPQRISLSGTARRVVHGGACNLDLTYARASYRSVDAPAPRFVALGLRVVRSSPSFA